MKTRNKKLEVALGVSVRESDERILRLFHACARNANDLLEEAYFLREKRRYARAAFLALTAFEEMRKAQLVADYATNCVSLSEFKKAFSDHRLKSAYMMREMAIKVKDNPNGGYRVEDTTIVYDRKQATHQIQMREKALYVSFGQGYKAIEPSSITADELDYILERVEEKFQEIEEAEWLNGRIGSKGLFK
jgi:AbiV family abortive infection protein